MIIIYPERERINHSINKNAASSATRSQEQMWNSGHFSTLIILISRSD